MNKLLALVVAVLSITLVYGSSHSEAPGTASIPNADITDLYAFMSYEAGRTGYVTFLMNVYPLQTPAGGPNYFTLSDKHYYELYLDTNADLVEDITFQFYTGNGFPGPGNATFRQYPDQQCVTDDPTPINATNTAPIALTVNGVSVPIALKVYGQVNTSAPNPSSGAVGGLNWVEWYYLNQIFGDRTSGTVYPIANTLNTDNRFFKPFDYVGEKTFGDAASYERYARSYINTITVKDYNQANCAQSAKVWVGQRKEAFNINLGRIFDLINFNPAPAFPNVIAECDSNNDLRDKNVDTLALEVHKDCLLPSTASVLGIWSATRTLIHYPNGTHGPGIQVSRMGNPLVNELVIGLPDKGNFNRQRPTQDLMFANYVFYPTLPAIIDLLFNPTPSGTPFYPTNFPRYDLVTTFLTGFAGFTQPAAANSTTYVGEVMRLNTTVPPTAVASSSPLGVIGLDLAGYPNGRRPFDDVVDISLRVVAGRLCFLVTNLSSVFGGFAPQLQCNASHAAIGGVDLTDGAPLNYQYVDQVFPYLRTPNPGSVTDSRPTECKATTYPYASSGTTTTTTGSATTGGGDGGNNSSGSASSLRSFLFGLF